MNVLKHAMKTTTILMLVALFSTSASATLDDAYTAYNKGDFTAAINEIRTLAEKGDRQAQYDLATMIGKGQGIKQDDVEATKWYRLAAEQNHHSAQQSLGERYLLGLGVDKDFTEGKNWLLKSAKESDKAQFLLGSLYLDGSEGFAVDNAEAIKWFTKAADQDYVDAQFNLGIL
ncbi:MAG: sel1 repeat family protein [Gallionella sp.]|nr:sel1 repeat family protein [Gallionella sp.]